MEAVGLNLIVKVIKHESAVSGIYLPCPEETETETGIVKSVGSFVKEIKEGDVVIFGSCAGEEVDVFGEKIRLIREEEVLAIVD